MATILCAVDFSECSTHALRWAGALAVRRGLPLIVFHAVDPLLAHAARARLDADLLDAEAQRGLHAFAAQAFECCTVQPGQIRSEIAIGDAWRSILKASAAHDASLLVMGTRGLGGIRKALLGSTAERVLRATTIPTLLVPENDRTATGDPGAAVKHVLAATDFGPSSKMAAQLAARLARDLASDLVLVHVVRPVTVPEQWRHYVDRVDEEHLARARTRLARTAHELLDDIRECSYETALGEPAATIATLGRDRAAGLIVLGLANRYDFEGARPGAVAYSVVRLSEIPVLVVPRTSHLVDQPKAIAPDGQARSIADKPAPTVH